MEEGVGGSKEQKQKVASNSTIIVLVGAELREFDGIANKRVFQLIQR